jgi:5-methylcytosine-specific restriction endonuclease McrA
MDYNGKRWKQKRELILRRDKHLCREHQRYGKRIDATMVHHIYPALEYPEWKFESWNLISLCNDCHEAMHVRLTGELTDKGKALQKRTPSPSQILTSR